jgi:general secretion pathway protein H
MTRHRTANGTHCAGFTLIEMLVVLAIMVLISGLGFPMVERALQRQQFESDRSRVYLAVAQARADALRGGRIVEVQEPSSADGLGPLRAGEDGLPNGTVLSFPPQGLRFYPDGTSSGGTVRLEEHGRSIEFTVNPDTGVIRVAS